MRILHTSDLHIGKRLKEQSLLEEQRYMLDQLLAIAIEQKMDAVFIAGDIYDKSIPSGEAVQLFDDFLTEMNSSGIALYIVAGNHDSADRIDFGSRILDHNKVHIAGNDLKRVDVSDEHGAVSIWLLPYMRSSNVIASLEAVSVDPSIRNIILSHQMVVSGDYSPEKSGSEVLSIGGIDAVNAGLYHLFDYVALGHIHRAQQAGAPHILYSGSPYRYDFGECSHTKGVWLVDIPKKHELTTSFIELTPKRDLYRISCTLAELPMQTAPRDGYIEVTLTDEEPIVDAMHKVRQVYPNTLHLDLKHRYVDRGAAHSLTKDDLLSKKPEELFAIFFSEMNGAEMSPKQIAMIKEAAEGRIELETT